MFFFSNFFFIFINSFVSIQELVRLFDFVSCFLFLATFPQENFFKYKIVVIMIQITPKIVRFLVYTSQLSKVMSLY